MPIYEHKCSSGHVTEDLRAVADRDTPGPCSAVVGRDNEGQPIRCAQPTARAGVEHCQFYMKYDATQLCAPRHPGMSGCQNESRRVPAGTVR